MPRFSILGFTSLAIAFIALAVGPYTSNRLSADDATDAKPEARPAPNVIIRSGHGDNQTVLTADRLELNVSPRRTAPPASRVCQFEVTLLKLDLDTLEKANIDLSRVLHACSERDTGGGDITLTHSWRAIGRGVGSSATAVGDITMADSWSGIAGSVLPSQAADALIQLLKASGAATHVASPKVRTQMGSPAECQIARAVPSERTARTVDGQDVKIRAVEKFMTTVELTPVLLDEDGKLELRVITEQKEMAKILPNPVSAHARNNSIQRIETAGKVRSGQCFAIAQLAMPPVAQLAAAKREGLMLLVHYSAVEHLDPGVAEESVQTTPSRHRRAERNSQAGYFRKAADSEPGRDSADANSESVEHAVRELRGEVRGLRQDVGRLIKLLDKEPLGAEARTPGDATEARIRQQLKKPVSLDFDETPLVEVIACLRDTGDSNFVLDIGGLEEEGVTARQPISIHVDGISLENALDLILQPLGLAFTIEDEVVKVTSRLRAQGRLETVTYPVADLIDPIILAETIRPDGEKTPTAELALLGEIIMATVAPDSWDVRGGPGSVRTYDKTMSLVIRQTEQAHQEIRYVIGSLRRLRNAHSGCNVRTVEVPQDRWEHLQSEEKAGSVLKRFEEGPGHLLLTQDEAKAVVEAFQGDESTNLSGPLPLMLLNDRRPTKLHDVVRFEKLPSDRAPRPLLLKPILGGQGLMLYVDSGSETSSGWVSKFHPVQIPQRQSVLVEATRRSATGEPTGVPILNEADSEKRLFTRVRQRPERRQLLLLTPKVAREESEEWPEKIK